MGRNLITSTFLRALACFFCITSLHAERPPVPDHLNPVGLEPGLVGKNLYNRNEPTAPPSTIQGLRVFQQPGSMGTTAHIRFVLQGVTIEGNHVFSTASLQAIFKPFLHRNITLGKLQSLVEQITDKYQAAGYFLSKAYLPPQQIADGIVHVSVMEGFISEVIIQGVDKPKLEAYLKKYETNITGYKPVTLKEMERYLLLINDIPGFTVRSVLAPDPKVDLGSTLTLVTEYKPFQAMLSRDNYQTRYLGPLENTLATNLNSVFLPGGTLYGRALSANFYHHLNYFELRHSQTIGTDGLVFTLDGYNTQTNPQFILAPLEVIGFSGDANAGLYYPIMRSRNRNLSIQGQFDYMNNLSFVLGEELYKDAIRDLTLTAQYADTVAKGDDVLSFVFDRGFNIFGAGSGAHFRSRTGAGPNYLKLILTGERTQYLNERFSLYALITGQYANSVLYAAETMIFGGPFIGRGYDWAQFTGDEGVAGKAEFRVNTAPEMPFLKQVQYYAFYDVGKLHNLTTAPDTSGASAGFGARAIVMNHFNAEVFIGKPLTTPNATQLILGESGHRFQGYFQATVYI